MRIIHELRKVANGYPAKAPPIPLVFNDLGQVGHVSNRRVYINSAMERPLRQMLALHYKADRVAREISNGRLGADDLLPIVRAGSDCRDAIRAIKSMRAAITSWDSVVNARASGKAWDYFGTKASQTTVANVWSSFTRTAGNPAAMSYNAIPGPAALDSNTTGAWPLPMSQGGTEDVFLTNLGGNHATGTNVVLAVDLIQAAGSISATVNTTQSVATTTNLRYTGGEGVLMTLEVTTALGATSATVTVSYADQSGGSSTTSAITLLTGAIAGRLVPVQDGPMIRFATGDYGVRQVNTVLLSASMAAGVLAMLMYKPLLLFPTLATTTFVERSTPAQIGGIRKLTDYTTSGSSKPCIGFFVLTSTTSTGVQTYLLETVWG
jgi:hypothetical protein